jgi:uncharacterized protein with PIN domain
MTKCVYCNRSAVTEKTETYEVNGRVFEHTFTYCESCKEDFVTPQQQQLNEERRSKP